MNDEAGSIIDRLIEAWGPYLDRDETFIDARVKAVTGTDWQRSGVDTWERGIANSLDRLLSTEEMAHLADVITARLLCVDWRSPMFRTLHEPRNAELRQRLWADGRRKHRARVAEQRRLAREAEKREQERALAEKRERQARLEAEQRRRDDEARRARELADAQERERIRRERELENRFDEAFKEALTRDFLTVDDVIDEAEAAGLDADAYRQRKAEYVVSWACEEDLDLDSEQAFAVAENRHHVQLTARAGSGKTRTLVARAVFLQKHCGVSPNEILLLAFNKKAALEMRERLTHHLGEALPHVMTFHALAYALIHPDEILLFDDTRTDNQALSDTVRRVIDEHVRSDTWGDTIRELMMAHFREDWEQLVDGKFHLTLPELLAYRRALPRETLQGETVKSFGEKTIANALFEHGLDYGYERNRRWNGINYRPDFTIALPKGGGIIIEYFGLTGDPDYDEQSEAKREYWASQSDWTLLEYSPSDITTDGVSGFIERLIADLREAGAQPRRLAEEEIWQLVSKRAIDSFTRAMRTFVGRCRKLNLGTDDLDALVSQHTAATPAEEMFLTVGRSIYLGYAKHLSENGLEDFDGLMWRAVHSVRDGNTRFARQKGEEHGDVARLRFVHIDEFQDFSKMFDALIAAISAQAPDMRVFCVGDDWQAINGFAGSDLWFFRSFPESFQDAKQLQLTANYRSPVNIVETGNALMQGLGSPARCVRPDVGRVWLCDMEAFDAKPVEMDRHAGDEITPAVLRIAKRHLDRDRNVVLLARKTTGLPWYINFGRRKSRELDFLAQFLTHIRSFLPEDQRARVTIDTVHGYKGLEQDAVILLDAVAGSFPLIHPHWVFTRVFGDSVERIVDEERRLFYVAITRAQASLALISASRRRSDFIDSIAESRFTHDLQWGDLQPASGLDGERVELRVFNAYDVREELKDRDFKFAVGKNYWSKSVLAEDFSVTTLKQEPWLRGSVEVKALNDAGDVIHELKA